MAKNDRDTRTAIIWTPPDVSGLADQVLKLLEKNIKKEATDDAANALPKEGSTQQYGIQKTIWDKTVSDCESLKDMFGRSCGAVRDILNVNCNINERLKGRGDDVDDKDMDAQLKRHPSIFAAIAAAKAERRKDLIDLRVDLIDTGTDLNVFREMNDLRHRSADYPDTNSMNIALVFLALFVETLLNGAMFQHVADGLVGGIMQAFFFSFINVLLGLSMGFIGLKNIIHKNHLRKALGGISILILTICGLGWNGFVAHYRELATDSVGIERVDAAKHMFEHPFDLATVESFALLFFGILIFFWMAYKAYCTFDDPYPSYGKCDRKQRKAREEYGDEQQDLRELIGEKIAEHRERYEDRIVEETNKADRAERNLEALLAHREDIIASMSARVNKGNLLLGLYREVNSRIRGGVRPKHFKDSLSVSDYADEGKASHLQIDKINDMVQDIRKIQLHNDPHLRHFIADTYVIEQNTLSELDDVFFKDISNEAAEIVGNRGNDDVSPDDADEQVSD